NGIQVISTGNLPVAPLTPGSVTVMTGGHVSGGLYGIYTGNFGTGASAITSTGTVHSDDIGIFAFNDPAATDLTIGVFDVSGENVGIVAQNGGTGTTTNTATGTVAGTYGNGISAQDGVTA